MRMCVLIVITLQPQFTMHELKSQITSPPNNHISPYFGQRRRKSTRCAFPKRVSFVPFRSSGVRARSGGKNARKVRTAAHCAKRRQKDTNASVSVPIQTYPVKNKVVLSQIVKPMEDGSGKQGWDSWLL